MRRNHGRGSAVRTVRWCVWWEVQARTVCGRLSGERKPERLYMVSGSGSGGVVVAVRKYPRQTGARWQAAQGSMWAVRGR